MKFSSLGTLGLIGIALAMSSCSSTTQNSSGAEYLAKYDGVATSAATTGDESFEETLRKVAAVEPVLSFPAKIGLARIEQGRLTALPADELKSWMDLRDNLGEDFGEFVLVNPMIAEMVSNSVKTKDSSISSINQIRLAGARQHLDAVLIYEVQTKSDGKDNLLSLGNITIIGSYVLPSETVEAEGSASAVLIDVLQGYPYGTADVSIDKQKGYATNNGTYDRGQEMRNEISKVAVEKLSPEVEKMFRDVREAADERAKKEKKK